VPRGTFVKFRPHSESFVTLAAHLGPRALLESALRGYSCLTKETSITVTFADERYLLDIVDLRPADTVCLYGDLDLEVEFEAIAPSPPSSAVPHCHGAEKPNGNGGEERPTNKGSSPVAVPRSLAALAGNNKGAVGAVPASSVASTSLKAPLLQGASKKALKFSKNQGKHRRFGGPGHTLSSNRHLPPKNVNSAARVLAPGPTSPLETSSSSSKKVPPPALLGKPVIWSCPQCSREIPFSNRELHRARCARVEQYHLVSCVSCGEKVQKGELEAHMLTHVEAPCPKCGLPVERGEQAVHDRDECPLRSRHCEYCELPFPAVKFAAHEALCGSRTRSCDVCRQQILLRDWAAHESTTGIAGGPLHPFAICGCPVCVWSLFVLCPLVHYLPRYIRP
jgi:hypothetical protein